MPDIHADCPDMYSANPSHEASEETEFSSPAPPPGANASPAWPAGAEQQTTRPPMASEPLADAVAEEDCNDDEESVDPLLAELMHQVYLASLAFDRENPQSFALTIQALVKQHPDYESSILMFVALLLGKAKLELLEPSVADTIETD
jgi:hypothetical protein